MRGFVQDNGLRDIFYGNYGKSFGIRYDLGERMNFPNSKYTFVLNTIRIVENNVSIF